MATSSHEGFAGDILREGLTDTDFAVLGVVLAFIGRRGIAPAAADIREKLVEASPVGKTQLYDRLSHLCSLGFLKNVSVGYPKRFYADEVTLERGTSKLLALHRERLESARAQSEGRLLLLNSVSPISVVSLVRMRATIES